MSLVRDALGEPMRIANLGMICELCREPCPRRGASQRYCEACSNRIDRERKLAWARTHPAKPENTRRSAARTQARKQIVAQVAANAPRPMWEPSKVGSSLAWRVEIALPFTYSFSKNALWSSAGGGGHVFLRRRASDARDNIVSLLHTELRRREIAPVEGRVFIDLFVQKPDHKGDAINVLDSVCDGVKVALGVDDRWFSVRGIDWEVVKHGTPMLTIGVGQEATDPQRVCSICGAAKTIDHFSKRAGMPLGVGRECRECLAAVRELTKASTP